MGAAARGPGSVDRDADALTGSQRVLVAADLFGAAVCGSSIRSVKIIGAVRPAYAQ
jgi:hypothetical protein